MDEKRQLQQDVPMCSHRKNMAAIDPLTCVVQLPVAKHYRQDSAHHPNILCVCTKAFPMCVLIADEISFLSFFCNKANQHLFEEKESEKEITKHSYQSYQNIKRKYSACHAACSVVFLWRQTSVRRPAVVSSHLLL